MKYLFLSGLSGVSLGLFCGLFGFVSSASAQPRVYEVEVEGGSYQVDLRYVTSVSVHRFFVDGALTVDELTIDTSGNTVARFYVVDRNREVRTPRGVGQSLLDKAQDKVDEAKERIGVTEWMDRAVVKSYPTTTHAHTVEYRVSNLKQLMELYDNLSDAWKKGRPGTFKIE